MMAQRLLVIAGLASVCAGFAHPSTGHDWYRGAQEQCRRGLLRQRRVPTAAARYNERTGLWETEVIKNTWLPVPSDAFAQIPSPDGNYHVCEYAGTIRCFFQPGEAKREPLDGAKLPDVAHGPSPFPHSAMYLATWLPERPRASLIGR